MFKTFDQRVGRPIGPEGLSLLHQVLVEFCEERCCARESELSLEAARFLIRHFQEGLTDGEQLRTALTEALPRR